MFDITKENLAIRLSQYFGLMCAFGIPWSNALFRVGLAGLLLFSVVSNAYYLQWRSLARNPAILLGLSMFAYIAVGALWVDYPADLKIYDVVHYRKLLALVPFMLVFNTERLCRRLLIAYCLGAIVLMLPTLAEGMGLLDLLKLNLEHYHDRSYSTVLEGRHVPNLIYWRNQIVHGFVVSVLLAVCLCAATTSASKWRWLFVAIGVLCITDVVLFIAGRMALISIIFVLVASLLLQLRRHASRIAFAPVAVLIVVTGYLTVPTIKLRIDSIRNDEVTYTINDNIISSGGQRLHYWNVSWKLFARSPILGNGAGSFRNQLVQSNDPLVTLDHKHAHNEYLTQLAQFGIIGLGLLVGLVALSMHGSRRLRDNFLRKSVPLVIMVFCLNALTDSSLHNDSEGWAFILFVTIACAGYARSRGSGGAPGSNETA